MRKAIVLALVGYGVSVTVLGGLLSFQFDSFIRSIIVACISIIVVYGILSKYSTKKQAICITMKIIAIFWFLFVIIDILGYFGALLFGGYDVDFINTAMMMVDEFVNSKIMAIVSGVVAYKEYMSY